MDEVLKKLRERSKRTVLRKIETGQITYDRKRKLFVYKDTEDEYMFEQKQAEDDEEEDEGNDSDDSEEN